jgi:anaerobic carbon-monoxide dehydrogenase iron sulfur subunit
MPPAKFKRRKFVSVDPSICTGCGICEYTCSQEKGESNPLLSRIRIIRMKPLFNFALACRSCEDAKCVKACPEKALSQAEDTALILVNEKKCKGCDWCVQACEHGGITIDPNTGLAVACDLCGGEPQCVEFCPEEALEIVETDEEAEKRFNAAVEKMPAQCEELTIAVKDKNWKPLLAEAEKRSTKVAEKLEALNKKYKIRKKQ